MPQAMNCARTQCKILVKDAQKFIFKYLLIFIKGEYLAKALECKKDEAIERSWASQGTAELDGRRTSKTS
jgi:hypothetical protein